ncbi:MAG: hypothetical protein JJU20_05545 [Opitutales bacterium]|nr:hypothetical protein [Opitutales bacterium]
MSIAGCQSYQWGEAGSTGEMRVYLHPVVNDSYAPQAATLLERELRTALVRDGGARLISERRRADAELEVIIEAYEEAFVSGRDDDTGRPASLSLDMTVQARWYRDGEEESIRFTESVPIYGDPSIRDGATMAFPQLAQKISRRIRDTLLHPWEIEP